jgi:hypothetical protein
MAIIFASRIVSLLERRPSGVRGFTCAEGTGFNSSSLISPFRERQRIRNQNWNKDCEGCTFFFQRLPLFLFYSVELPFLPFFLWEIFQHRRITTNE